MDTLCKSTTPAAGAAALLVLAIAACLAMGQTAGEGDVAPLVVTVKPAGRNDSRLLVPVEFEAPVAERALSVEVSSYLEGSARELFACEVDGLERDGLKEGYRWARIRAAVPLAERTYLLSHSGEVTRPEVPLVSSLHFAGKAVLETDGMEVRFAEGRFTIVNGITIKGAAAVPDYVEGLLNRQQGLELVVRDPYRYLEFALHPKITEEGLRLKSRGPVVASVTYEGVFAGPDAELSVPFAATVSLQPGYVLGVKVTLSPDEQWLERFEINGVRLTMPLLLKNAARISVGGGYESFSGAEHWKGRSVLEMSAEGEVSFVEAEGSMLKVKGPVSWIDYADCEAGVTVLPEAGTGSLTFAADYNEDLLELTITPGAAGGGRLTAGARYFFHGTTPDPDVLSMLAEAYREPPKMVVNETYLDAVSSKQGTGP